MHLHADVVGQNHPNWSQVFVDGLRQVRHAPTCWWWPWWRGSSTGLQEECVCVCVIFTAGLLNSQLALWSVLIPDTHYKQLTPVRTDIPLHEVGGREGSQPHLRRMDLHCSTHVNLHPSSSSFSGVRREHIAALYIYHILWAAEQGKQKEIWGC